MGEVHFLDLIAPAFEPVCDDVLSFGHRHYWLKGGRGSTKSSCISLCIALGLAADETRNAVIFRKVADTLYDSVYTQMAWALAKLGIAHLWQLGKSPMRITNKATGQQILFLGADDPAKSKSIKAKTGYFAYVWFEELTEFNGMDEIRTITQSLLRGGGPAACFYSYNPPKSAQNWVNAEVTRAKPDRMTHHSTYLDVPRDWLGETWMVEAEQLRGTNDMAYRHEYLGEVTGTGGQVFDNVTLREITELERVTFDDPKVGLDFGFAVDPDAVTVSHYNRALRKLYVFGEYYKTGSSFDATAAAIRRLNPWGAPVTADSAEPRSIHELTQRGIRATGAYKPPGSVEHGVRWLQDLAEIVIDPGCCPNAAREFQAYEYERNRDGSFRASFQRTNDHSIDSVRYGNEDHIGYRQVTAGRREDYGI
jgi:PBSX family phage terminase large subunit